MADGKAAYNLESLTPEARGEIFQSLASLLAGKTRLLCIGTSSLSLAQRLANEAKHDVTLLADSKDYLDAEKVSPVKLVVESLESPDLHNRFKRDQFDAIVLADPPHEQSSIKAQLGNFLAYFDNAIVVSLPEVLSREKATIRHQESEISRLKQVLSAKEETIAWYSKRMREQLVNHYKLEKTHAVRMKFEDEYRDKLARAEQRAEMLVHEVRLKQKQHDALLEDRDRLAEYAERASIYSGDKLPKLIRIPVKAFMMLLTCGPLEPLRLLRKKKS